MVDVGNGALNSAIDPWTLSWVTFLQGVGMGLVFIPMNLMAFSTMPQYLRTDGTAIMSLMRNVGSAIGVSVTTTVLSASVQTNHAMLASHVTPFNRALGVNAPGVLWNPQMPFGLNQINGVIEYNAQVIAYSNDFLFMFYMSLPAILVVLLMKRVHLAPGTKVEVME